MIKDQELNLYAILNTLPVYFFYLIRNPNVLEKIVSIERLRDKISSIEDSVKKEFNSGNTSVILEAYAAALQLEFIDQLSESFYKKLNTDKQTLLTLKIKYDFFEKIITFTSIEELLEKAVALNSFESYLLFRKNRKLIKNITTEQSAFLKGKLEEASNYSNKLNEIENKIKENEKLSGYQLNQSSPEFENSENVSKISGFFSDLNGLNDILNRSKFDKELKEVFKFKKIDEEKYEIYFNHKQLNEMFFQRTGLRFKIMNENMDFVEKSDLITIEEYKKLFDEGLVPLDLRNDHDLGTHILRSFQIPKEFWAGYKKELKKSKNQSNNDFYYKSFEGCAYLTGVLSMPENHYKFIDFSCEVSGSVRNPELEESWITVLAFFKDNPHPWTYKTT